MCLPHVSIMDGLFSLVLFSFTNLYYKTLVTCLRWLLGRFPIWIVTRDLILRVSSIYLSKQAACVSPPKFLGGLVVVRSSGWFFGVFLAPLFLAIGYSLKLLEWMHCCCKQCTRKSCPCLLLIKSSDKEGLLVCLPCYPKILLSWTYFLVFYE